MGRQPGLTPAKVAALDADDPLASFRDRFLIPDDGLVYMDGNSLGRPTRATVERLRSLVETEWAGELVGSWESWIDLPARVGDGLAESFLGAQPGEVVLSDSTTVNLFKLASAAVTSTSSSSRRVIVTDEANFPSDLYVLEGVAAAHGLELRPVPMANVRGALSDEVALLALSHVDYRTGELHDMVGLTAAAHDVGALALWDVCHSVGVVPIELERCDVDLAAGCTYKYLNGGPGSPAFLYVRRRLHHQLRQPIWGWFGQRDQFAMGRRYDPAPAVGSWVVGTPSIVAGAAVEAAVEVAASAGVEAIRTKSVGLTSLAIELFDSMLAPLGFELATPREADRRGSHVSFRHPEAWRLCRALIDGYGVVPDFREPDVIRYGVAPLYTRFADVWEAVDRLRRAVEERAYERVAAERRRVT